FERVFPAGEPEMAFRLFVRMAFQAAIVEERLDVPDEIHAALSRWRQAVRVHRGGGRCGSRKGERQRNHPKPGERVTQGAEQYKPKPQGRACRRQRATYLRGIL